MRRDILTLSVTILAAVTTLSGCPGPTPTPTGPIVPTADPESRSGPDASRAAAVAITLGVAATDEVSFDRQDRTDWKKVELPPRPGVLAVDLRWDDPNVELDCDVYDSLGQQIATSPRAASEPRKRLLVQVDAPAVHYLRVQAPRPGVGSVYSLLVRYDDGGARTELVPPDAGVASDAGAADAATAEPDQGTSGQTETEREADEVQGRIVAAYPEGGYLVLQIDKGAAAGVTVGAKGRVLAGPAGSEPVPGGDFTITVVVDETKSIGKTRLKSLGPKNRRVAIQVGAR